MFSLVALCFGMVVRLFRGRRSLLLEHFALRQQRVALKRRHPRAGLSRPAISQWLAGLQPSELEDQIPRLTFTNQLTRRAVPEASFGLSIHLATCPLSMYFVGSPGAELADDPSKLCCLVIIVRVSIDNDMERVVARHLPESGPQSRRRFGALQIHQHPMPFFASLFQIANRTDLQTRSLFRNKLRRFLAGFPFLAGRKLLGLRFQADSSI